MAHIKRRLGRWQATYRGPDHKERTRTFDRRVDAQKWLALAEADVARAEWIDPRLGKMTFAEWVDRWESTLVDLRPTTRVLNVGVARNYLVPRFGTRAISSIARSDVMSMLAEELGEGRLSSSAIRRHVMVLSLIMKAAAADGRIARNPCAGVRLPAEVSRPMRFLEAHQVAGLVDAMQPAHYRPLVLTAAYVGLRWGELAGLEVRNVDLLRHRIRVERQLIEANGQRSFGPPKTRAGSRTVTLPASLGEVLGVHFADPAVQSSGLAFPSPKGELMRRPVFQRAWQRACRAAELEGLVFHELRHTAAALAIALGAHPMAIKERLGHSSITVTLDRYGGLFPRLDEAIAQGLDGVLRNSLADFSRTALPAIAHLRTSEG